MAGGAPVRPHRGRPAQRHRVRPAGRIQRGGDGRGLVPGRDTLRGQRSPRAIPGLFLVCRSRRRSAGACGEYGRQPRQNRPPAPSADQRRLYRPFRGAVQLLPRPRSPAGAASRKAVGALAGLRADPGSGPGVAASDRRVHDGLRRGRGLLHRLGQPHDRQRAGGFLPERHAGSDLRLRLSPRIPVDPGADGPDRAVAGHRRHGIHDQAAPHPGGSGAVRAAVLREQETGGASARADAHRGLRLQSPPALDRRSLGPGGRPDGADAVHDGALGHRRQMGPGAAHVRSFHPDQAPVADVRPPGAGGADSLSDPQL